MCFVSSAFILFPLILLQFIDFQKGLKVTDATYQLTEFKVDSESAKLLDENKEEPEP